MTWTDKSKRWCKKHKGQLHFVSVKQLKAAKLLPPNAPETKYGSWQAANQWWNIKQAELDAEPEAAMLDPVTAQIVGILNRNPVPALQHLMQRGEAARAVLTLLAERQTMPTGGIGFNFDRLATVDEVTAKGIPATKIDLVLRTPAILDEGKRAERIADLAHTINPAAPVPDRTIAAQAKAWVDFHYTRHLAGEISAGRWDAYKRNVGTFQEWIGGETDVSEIDGPKAEAFYKFLARKLADGVYSVDYCKNIMQASKNFWGRLEELGIIPAMPASLLRRLRFTPPDDDDKTPVHFTVDEVKALLAACGAERRTKLFMLLMLNCGMYQNDIAQLMDRQVDWQHGTICRKRSKRRRGGYKVTYKLWRETFALLKEFRSGGERVLVSDEGNTLVSYDASNGSKIKRYDLVREAYGYIARRCKQKKSIKLFRKTSATLLDHCKQHKEYRAFTTHFLAHAPSTLKDRNYVPPDDAEFFEALAWLGEQYGVE